VTGAINGACDDNNNPVNQVMKMKRPRNPSPLLTLLAVPVLLTQVARADYQSAVLANGPKAYYRLNDSTNRSPINVNSGSLGLVAGGA